MNPNQSSVPNAPGSDPSKIVGKPVDRVDGRLKVTGGARYSAEMPVMNLAHGVLIMSTVAKGRIESMDTREAEALPGVRHILTPFNAPRLPKPDSPGGASGSPQDRKLSLLQDTTVYYNNQPIGVVVADTLEQARDAAERVRVRYKRDKPTIDLQSGAKYTPKQVQREEPNTKEGDIARGKKAAKAVVEAIYTTPMENHNPMEPHATVAVWESDDRLTVYDATQGVFGVQKVLAKMFAVPAPNVRCVSHFLGGGFGCKGTPWSHVVLTAMAAKTAGRPVKINLTRAQMYGPVGYRPQTEQKMLLAGTSDGKLTATQHDVLANTSSFDEFVEPSAIATRMLYDCPNRVTTHQLSRIDAGTPTYMRAPGEASGTWTLEAAMDELAYALNIDPIELRLQNYAEADPTKKKPFSSKSLRECYRVGAEEFGWAKRTPAPRSMKTDDGRLLGMGMASATYPTNRGAASALARLLPDGTAYVEAGSQDIGTGTYTVMTQIAADALGLPFEKVRFQLGDTKMPETPVSGGSQTAASVGSAVKQACLDARLAAIAQATTDTASPLHGMVPGDIEAKDGRLYARADATKGEEYGTIVKRSGKPNIEANTQSKPGDEKEKYSMHSFGAIFAEVAVDPDTAEVRLLRLHGAYGVGNILNAKTARSQLIGGMIYGVGMALMEETMMDKRYGRVMNADLAEYHVPVNKDIPPIGVTFVPEEDTIINPIGVKGIGEIGITGVVAAIGNAIYHATGVRVRDLPLTLDKVLQHKKA